MRPAICASTPPWAASCSPSPPTARSARSIRSSISKSSPRSPDPSSKPKPSLASTRAPNPPGTETMSTAAYVRCVLDLYLSIPETQNRARPADRRLAAPLERQGTPLNIVAAAFVLATARRHYRDPEAPVLPPVRSLHYYLPVIEELL